MRKRLIIPAALLLILTLVSGCAVAIDPASSVTPKPTVTAPAMSLADDLYQNQTGPFAVKFNRDIVLTDAARGKKLAIRITWPVGDGPFPVIVWSHGLGGTKDLNQPLIAYWASYGYVCVQMSHSDSLQVTLNPDTADWASRPLDIEFALDNLEQIADLAGISGKLDTDSIGVGGHSFGAHTAQLVGGAVTNTLTGDKESYADPRPKAFLMISPQGTGALLSEDAWQDFTRPAMMITGSEDTSPTGPNEGNTYEWRLEAWQGLPPGDKYLLFIEGADHVFGGISGITRAGADGSNEDHVNYVRTSALAFWDTYLKADGAAQSYLESGSLAAISDNEAYIETK